MHASAQHVNAVHAEEILFYASHSCFLYTSFMVSINVLPRSISTPLMLQKLSQISEACWCLLSEIV